MPHKYKRGDIISYCDELYIVLTYNGDRGRVVEYFPGPNEFTMLAEQRFGSIIDPFYWKFCGSESQLVGHAELHSDLI